MITRRESLKIIAKGLGATAFGSSFVPQLSLGAESSVGLPSGPKRVVFFMQNQGFDPQTCIPTNMRRTSA